MTNLLVDDLALGNAKVLMVVQDSHDPALWYRVNKVWDRAQQRTQWGHARCDCAAWIRMYEGVRDCTHCRLAARSEHPAAELPSRRQQQVIGQAIQARWPELQGVDGAWKVLAWQSAQDGHGYILTDVRLATPSHTYSGIVAQDMDHDTTMAHQVNMVVEWCGWQLAAQVMGEQGLHPTSQVPQHASIPPITHRGYRDVIQTQPFPLRQDQREGEYTPYGRSPVRDTYPLFFPVTDIQAPHPSPSSAQQPSNPDARAESLLQELLGPRYALLCSQGYLDVDSTHCPGRTYRVRLDPKRGFELRIRVFQDGTYHNDVCIIRGEQCPVADHFLTVYLGLCTDELRTLSVADGVNPDGSIAQRGDNVFAPYSERYTRRNDLTTLGPIPHYVAPGHRH